MSRQDKLVPPWSDSPPQPDNGIFIRLHTIFLSEREKRDGWTIERLGRLWTKVLRDEKRKITKTRW